MSAIDCHFPLNPEEVTHSIEGEDTEGRDDRDTITRLVEYSSASFSSSAPPRLDFCRLLIEHTCSQLTTYAEVGYVTEGNDERHLAVLRVMVIVLDKYSHSHGNVEPIKEYVSHLLKCWHWAAVKSKTVPLPLNMVLYAQNLRSTLNLVRLLLDCTPQEIDLLNTPSALSGHRPLHHLMKSDMPLVDKKRIAQLMVDKGAHIDAVDRNGKDATHAFFPLSLKSPVHVDINHIHDLVCLITHEHPPPLCCLAAKSVISNDVDYHQMLLPPRLKQIISYHDPDASLYL